MKRQIRRHDLQEERWIHKMYDASSDPEDRQEIRRNRHDLVHLISSAFTYNSAGATLK